MKFIKKVLKWMVYLVLLLILLLVGVYFAAGFLIKTAVSTVVPPITQTTASIDDVDLSLFSGKVAFKGLKIGNPAGFSDKNVFELNEISVSFDPQSVLTDKILVHKVKIDGVTVNAELNAKMDTNLSVIKKNVQNFVGSDDKASSKPKEAETKAQSSSGKNVVIKDLIVSNVSMNPGTADMSAKIALPTIHLTNIGESKKQSIPDIIATLLNKITAESIVAFAKNAQNVIKGNVKSISDSIKGLIN